MSPGSRRPAASPWGPRLVLLQPKPPWGRSVAAAPRECGSCAVTGREDERRVGCLNSQTTASVEVRTGIGQGGTFVQTTYYQPFAKFQEGRRVHHAQFLI